MDNVTAAVLGVLAGVALLILAGVIARHHYLRRYEHLTWSLAGTAVAATSVRNVCFMLVARGQHRECPNCYDSAKLVADASQLPAAHGLPVAAWAHPAALARHRGWLDPEVSTAAIVAESYRKHDCKEVCSHA